MGQLLKWCFGITLTIMWCIPLHQLLIDLMPTYWKKEFTLGSLLYYLERIYFLSIPLAAITAGLTLWLVSKLNIRSIWKLRSIICLGLGISTVFLFVKLYAESPEQLDDLLDDFLSKDHYRKLWNTICVRPWNLIQAHLIHKPWIWKPTYSQVINGLITLVSTTLWFIVLLIALVIITPPPFLVFIFLSTISLAFVVSLFFAGFLNYVLSYAVFYLTKGGIWVLNDLFRTNIHIANDEEFFGSIFENGLYSVYGVFLGLGLYAAAPLLCRIAERCVLTPFAVVFYGAKIGEERKTMKRKRKKSSEEVNWDEAQEAEWEEVKEEETEEAEQETIFTKQYDIVIPPKLSRARIRSDIRRYSRDKGVLRNYFIGLAQRFDSKSERKIIQVEMERLKMDKEFLETMREHRIVLHQLFRVDMEEEVKRLKKEEDLELAKLSKDVKRAEMEAHLAKFQADKERHQAEAKEYREGKREEAKDRIEEIKERIEQIKSKVITIADVKRSIREEYSPEEAEEITEELMRQLVQEGELSEDY